MTGSPGDPYSPMIFGGSGAGSYAAADGSCRAMKQPVRSWWSACTASTRGRGTSGSAQAPRNRKPRPAETRKRRGITAGHAQRAGTSQKSLI
nr:MAG TPA: hypothetical protein [Caudoviricetes sp.]